MVEATISAGRLGIYSDDVFRVEETATGRQVSTDQAFLLFHRIFFPEGNFLFGADSNLLRLFPDGFWFESSLAAGFLIVLSALAATLAGWRLLRR